MISNNFNIPNFNFDTSRLDKAREEAFEKQEQQHMAILKTAEAAANATKNIEKLNNEIVKLKTDLELEQQERIKSELVSTKASNINRMLAIITIIIAFFTLIVTAIK